MLGVLQEGCIFVPLNDDSPAERLRHVVTWLQPKLFLTTESKQSAAKSLAASLDKATSVLRVPGAGENIPDEESSLTPRPRSERDLVPTS